MCFVATACDSGSIIDRQAKELISGAAAAGGEVAQLDHFDAIDGAGRQAQIAAGAVSRKHRMHAFRTAHDRVDRTRLYTKLASDATLFVDDCGSARAFPTVLGIKGDLGFTQKVRNAPHAGLSSRRTLVV
jgi:hypothetical protein